MSDYALLGDVSRGWLDRTRKAIRAGELGEACDHKPLRTQIGAVMARHPELGVRCRNCYMAAAQTLQTDDRCDECGKQSTTFRELIVDGGAFLIGGHICDACYLKNEATTCAR